MTTAAIVLVFIVGYGLIASEGRTEIDKGASALLTGFLMFAIIALFGKHDHAELTRFTGHLTGEIAQIVFFLLGAMTIVEMVSLSGGFDIIARKIRARSKRKLLFLVASISFIFSAFLDNLTTSLVMYTIVCELIDDPDDRMTFAAIIIIAANGGGAWFTSGDVTTTQNWVAGKISTLMLIKKLFIPSLISVLIPVLWTAKDLKGSISSTKKSTAPKERKGAGLILTLGIVGLISVPILKATLHLPPWICMAAALGMLWMFEEYYYEGKAWVTVSQAEALEDAAITSSPGSEAEPITLVPGRLPAQNLAAHSGHEKKTIAKALETLEIPSLLFFIGILSAVGALEHMGILEAVGLFLDRHFAPNTVASILGVISALVDNVPLDQAALKMYAAIPAEDGFWYVLTFAVGTGGSLLVIGSAAGVALMKRANLTFGWYLKRFTLPVLVGYLVSITMLILSN